MDMSAHANTQRGAADQLTAIANDLELHGGVRDDDVCYALADQVRELANALMANDDLLALHQMLFPQRYPRAAQPDHIYWDGRDEHDEPAPFQWSAGTIEWVAEYLTKRLAGHPHARLEAT
jgi:hypothetical protein